MRLPMDKKEHPQSITSGQGIVALHYQWRLISLNDKVIVLCQLSAIASALSHPRQPRNECSMNCLGLSWGYESLGYSIRESWGYVLEFQSADPE